MEDECKNAKDPKERVKNVILVPVEGKSKLVRAESCSPTIEAGHCYLPHDQPWAQAFIEEWASFPNGTHDDRVDACSQVLNKAAKAIDWSNCLPVGIGRRGGVSPWLERRDDNGGAE
jgi:phage terminase large subunit-like protein